MIDTNNPVFSENVKLLFEGFWYKELPPLFDISSLSTNIENIVRKISEKKYNDQYKLTSNDLICEFQNIVPPSYIYNDGCEAIAFFDFKKNGSLREMQIPNLKHYIGFVYNVLACYDGLFKRLYGEGEFAKYVEHSNSFLLFNEEFHINTGYDEEEYFEEGIFAVNNDKTTGQLVYEENNIRYLKKQGSYTYSVKIDIESFYPNIYTHYLSKIKDISPISEFQAFSEFFDFLDYYNMKINNNQTKGIVTGVFSSVMSSELLMLCVDHEIKNVIGDTVDYIRYVDDLTFFSDSLEEINTKLASVQQILNKYRLRINNSKTEQLDSIHNSSYININEIKNKFQFLNPNTNISLDKDEFYKIKQFIAQRYDDNCKSEIKAFLTLLKSAILNEHLKLEEDGELQISVYLAFYMIQLSCLEPLLASRCYKVIAAILDKSDGLSRREEIIEELQKKSSYINKSYNETILQIWHYYLLGKYDSGFNISDYLEKIGSNEANPIILAALIKTGRRNNKDIMKYIKTTYSNIEKEENEPDYWKISIMNSKWWLPLFILYLKDNCDYDRFFSSAHFNKIYKSIVNP